jgi:mRNA interferase RelE/StbE
MPSWKLKISQSVVKDLRALPKDAKGRAALSILELTATPYPPGAEKIQGYAQTYRVRVGDYRIVYEISGDEVTIIAVSHRKEVYRDLK